MRLDIAASVLVIPRYAPADMAALFSDAARLAGWLEVELLATEAQAALGVVPAEDAAACRAKAPAVDDVFVAEVAEREKVTDHDVAAFVDVVQERIGAPPGSWMHYGLTSSDVVDTALSATLTAAADLILSDLDTFVAALKARALELLHVPVTGRTHGMHAEPTTFGAKFALWALQADRDRRRMRAARAAVAVGKLSGAVGTYSNVDPAVEAQVCAALGLDTGPGHAGHRPRPPRRVPLRLRRHRLDRGADLHRDPASGTERARGGRGALRCGPEGELGHAAQAQPHPLGAAVRAARLLRGYLGAGLEDVALWHERDISHSSVERVALPDASLLACYVLRKATGLASGLIVHAERARRNLTEGSLGLVFSQSVLLALVQSGLTRDEAYRIVQRDARRAWSEQRPLRTVLVEDAEVALGADELDAAFDLGRTLRHVDRFADALAEL